MQERSQRSAIERKINRDKANFKQQVNLDALGAVSQIPALNK